MRLSVVGIGHVGLATGACFARIGHDVIGVDVDAARVEGIGRGEIPFHEPGLADLVRAELASGRLAVSSDVADAADADAAFVCVSTPSMEDGSADLRAVEEAATTLASACSGDLLLAQKSTVPVGTAARVEDLAREAVRTGVAIAVASNPEFLREGHAIDDTLRPDRIVVGARSAESVELLRRAYRPIIDETGCAFVATDVATAELVKQASNAFLATRISFANLVADLCERTGADVETVTAAMGMDGRIGAQFLSAGLGYGGGCIPKDVAAFSRTTEKLGVDASLLREVERINVARADVLLSKVRSAAGPLVERRIAVWGLAFKPGTDDLRSAPGIDVARRLLDEGADVVAFDPEAMPAAKSLIPRATFASDPYEAAAGAACLVICTDWKEFRAADLERLRSALAAPVVVDGRNLFDPEALRENGFRYVSIGRPSRDGAGEG
jgi:UDPglucose 6-dehydrogenase